MASTVSENIHRTQQKKGISQYPLSKDADLVLNIATRESPNLTVNTLEKTAKALGVSVAGLFK